MMKKLLIIVFFSFSLNYGCAQTNILAEKYPYGKLTSEPGIGTRLSSLMGVPNVQITNLLQYNVIKRPSLILHTSFNYQFGNDRIEDVKQNLRLLSSSTIWDGYVSLY
ncbi:hypothetical protein BH23BAC2_BH23BAC2_00150 [soil metagenome]